MCVYVCVYVRVYVCVYVCVRVYVCTCALAHLHPHTLTFPLPQVVASCSHDKTVKIWEERKGSDQAFVWTMASQITDFRDAVDP